MNTLLVFLVRRDQVVQLMAYLLIGTLLIALEMGVARPDRDAAELPAASSGWATADARGAAAAQPLLR